MKTKRRLYVPDTVLAIGKEIVLPAEPSHYLNVVLRLSAGDEVHLFNATQGEWLGEIETARKGEVKVKIKHQTRAAALSSSHRLTLSFAPLKKDRTDFLVEKASELGVHFLQPVFTDHTQSDRVNIERLQANAIEAAEQCDRLDTPQILAPIKLQNYLDSLFRHPGEGRDPVLFLAAESGDALPIAAAFQNAKSEIQNCAAVHFLIGPEGGFSPAEFARFDRHPNIRRIRLGPRLLRAETAAIAVLSAFQAISGDWQD